MKKLFQIFVFSTLVILMCSWGFFAHRQINRLAVFTVPAPLFGFYKANIEYLTEHAVDADKRRYSDEAEACRHYLDADHYEQLPPIDTIPKYWKQAVEKYTEDTLKAYGIVPWHIHLMTFRLTEAFKQKDKRKILRLSADLGHYVADAHVPLHATENYNGQLTGQTGIHGFWESRLPELFSNNYDFFTGKAHHIEDVQQAAWVAVNGSFAAVDSVLRLERELSKQFPDDRKYAFEQKGNMTVRVYSKEYAAAYDRLMGDMVERRMRASVILVGSLWYTAWVNSGQPDLDKLEVKPAPEEEQKLIAEQEKKFNSGKIIGRSEE
ncbi:MAG: zinc dependent phospholipase C family protein [Bacteroidia bacterium]|nr:zinc dependent phospholipase C family protein [Bacteroidia bacterium]MBP7260385.1 zinc dependent phospholipase C family protein [Bacteroidia bacterium]MBP9180164.1 zinc dependent phospholipase C family protein [Bacteroidia bacterium]MBP9724275.1 zinc dependent phospholipase C family protein [Bacteroidia bacterium]